MGFTGANFGTRVKATGYTGSPAFEVMAFVNEPTRAVSTWVNSVWHRIPILSPWVTELGYGAAKRGQMRAEADAAAPGDFRAGNFRGWRTRLPLGGLRDGVEDAHPAIAGDIFFRNA